MSLHTEGRQGMSPGGWHLDARGTTALLALVVGCLASAIPIVAGPAGASADSGAAILSGFLAALAVLLRNTSDMIPTATVTTVTTGVAPTPDDPASDG